MAKIYKRTDRVTVRIDDIIVKLAPLSLHQKTEIQVALIESRKAADVKLATQAMALSLKYAVKGIEGVQDSDGNPYQLQFDADKNLTDECIDDLMNLELSTKLILVASSMASGVPQKFISANTKDLEGVEIVKSGDDNSEKK